MPKPILSICIPTRNRRGYLQATLQSLLSPSPFPFDVEIIVSDNAGDDGTGEMVEALIANGAPLRYFRQSRDVGVVNNMYAAFRRAEGEFTVYLADDDRLLPDNLVRSVAWLRANPRTVALFGPWETYDAVTNRREGVSFMLDQDVEFGPGDRLALLDFLLRHSFIPEVPLTRSAALGSSLFGSTNIYWAYLTIDRLLQSGSVRFANLPYYRSIIRHWEGERRSTVSTRNSLAQWDSFRRGLDYLFWRARDGQALGAAQHAEIAERIAEQGRAFLGNAFGGRLGEGDFKGAAEIALLLAAADMPPVGSAVRDTMLMYAAADQILEVFDLLGDLDGVATFGFPSPENAAALFQARRAGLTVETIDDANQARVGSAFLTVASDRVHRDRLLERGFAPGRVIDFTRLLGFAAIPASTEGGAPP